MNTVPSEVRIAHIGALEGLVRIPQQSLINSVVSSYFLLLNSLDEQSNDSALVSEHVSTGPNVNAISNFLKFVKQRYEAKFAKGLRFRIIVSDYSWAFVRAICEELNVESVYEYAQHMFGLSNGQEEFNSDKTYMVSSATQTVECFLIALEDALPELDNADFGETKTLFCFAFGLLMNCIDMQSMTSLYKALLILFLSKTVNPKYKECCKQLNTKIHELAALKVKMETVSGWRSIQWLPCL
jgi:hypothetical protein